MAMPIMIELRLKASWQVRPDTKQLHGMACAMFEGETTDHFGPEKPFAVWPLSPAQAGNAHDWEWRAGWLPTGLAPVSALAADQIRLGHVRCAVTEARQRSVSHAQLAAGPAMGSARMTFRSATYFSQNSADVVVPEPRLIVGSWRRRWNASLPAGSALMIDDDVWRESYRAIRLTEFDLRTERRDSGRGHERAGFTGTATLRVAKEAPGQVRSVFGTLVRFAEFCGTGAQTTHGFGATTMTNGRPGGSDGGVAGSREH
jgi:CRISPR-associated endoribonuclease Cas6